MSESMVEMVARAIWDAYQTGQSVSAAAKGIEWDTVVMMRGYNVAASAWYADAMAEARAAIEAMREPTEGMKIAGAGELIDFNTDDAHPDNWALNTWASMIDAALSSPTNTD